MGRNADAARRAVGKAFARLPESAKLTLRPSAVGYRRADIRTAITTPAGDVRLLVAPVNFAGQAYRWARAAELVRGVGAVNMQYRDPRTDLGFEADYAIPRTAFLRNERWARRHFEIVSSQFTHVLIEAVRPLFGPLFDGDVEAEVSALRDAGVTVGMIVHGSEVRLPSQHMADNPWSPYFAMPHEQVESMEKGALERREVLRRVDAPIFASTTTLARIVPGAQWLPVVVDPEPWTAPSVSWEGRAPVVVHVPSSGVMKGSDVVGAVCADLARRGVIEYREDAGVQASRMPAHYLSADVVVDAVRMGNYGVAACEAMAAGRVTLCHLNGLALQEATRRGITPPLVCTDPDSLADDLAAIVAEPALFTAHAARGPQFVRDVHDGRRSAEVLAPFLAAPLAGAGGG